MCEVIVTAEYVLHGTQQLLSAEKDVAESCAYCLRCNTVLSEK